MHSITLQTQDRSQVLALDSIDRFEDGSGYRALLFVQSGAFACRQEFFFEDATLAAAIAGLETMDAGTPAAATIRGSFEDDYIRLESNSRGHVLVTGEIHEHGELGQMLRFGFRTDQTVLGPLIRDLNQLRSRTAAPVASAREA